MSRSRKIGCGGVALALISLLVGWLSLPLWWSGSSEFLNARSSATPKTITCKAFIAAGPLQSGHYRITGCLLNLSRAVISGSGVSLFEAKKEFVFTDVDAPVIMEQDNANSFQFKIVTKNKKLLNAVIQAQAAEQRGGKSPENVFAAKDVITASDGSLLLKYDVTGFVSSHQVAEATMSDVGFAQFYAPNWVLVDESATPSMKNALLYLAASIIICACLLAVWIYFIRYFVAQ